MIIRADARYIPLKDGCVQTVVTSPPYFGLRSYPDARQIGLEPTPDAYVANLVAVFADVWRVLREDGTVWLVLGDSYVASPRGNKPGDYSTSSLTNPKRQDELVRQQYESVGSSDGLVGRAERADRRWRARDIAKPKDLLGIPWRVAFALQAWGWYLRSDIIWAKPNPMPESVTDRPTKSHEYIFLLSKNERYYYDAAAIAEPVSSAMLQEMEQGYDGLGLKDYEGAGVQNPSSVKARIIAGARSKLAMLEAQGSRNDGERIKELGGRCGGNGVTRNRRTVWTVPTTPYAGAHFATFPEKLIEPCILAGCSLGGLVLDPFCGSGTTVAVAQRLGRRGVGTDLSYQGLARERTRQLGLLSLLVEEA